VQYVENIRSYYNQLRWLTEENQIKKNVMLANKSEPSVTPPANTDVSIDTPPPLVAGLNQDMQGFVPSQ
jgi:membrane-bound lytic murein transglycosylase MltF